MTKLSTIIPNYNHASYLNQRIDTVLNQTSQPNDILILDDSSTDHSLKVINQYVKSNPNLQFIANQRNSGSVFRQWNKGVSLAKGEYLWLAESDDYADKELLARLVAVLDNNSSVGIAYCQSYSVDANGKSLGDWQKHTDDLDAQLWQKDFVMNGKEAVTRFMFKKNIIPNASAVVFRKFVYDKVGGADDTFRLNGDWDLWIRMLLVSDLAYVAEPLNYFRSHSNTVRGKTIRGKNIEEWSILLKRYLPKVIDSLAERRVLIAYFFDIWKSTHNIPFGRQLRIVGNILRAILLQY